MFKASCNRTLILKTRSIFCDFYVFSVHTGLKLFAQTHIYTTLVCFVVAKRPSKMLLLLLLLVRSSSTLSCVTP